MGLGGELPVASTLVSESVAAKERGRVVVLLESFWAAGWLIAALISYFVIPTWGWRVALILTALPAFYAIYLRWHLPDSPQFTVKEEAKTEHWPKYERGLVEKVCSFYVYAVVIMVYGCIFVLWHVFMVAKCNGREGL